MASSAGFKSNVPSFEPNNFNGWVRLFRAYLMRHDGLNETLDDSSDDEVDETMTEKNRQKMEKLKKINLATASVNDDKLLLLHNRSGHLNYSALHECVKNELLLNTGVKPKDIRDSKNKTRPICDVCARSKGTRTSFKPVHGIRGKLFGDYISVDIVSYSVPSRDGYVYVLTFTDHASKKSKSYPLINRTGDIILLCLRDYIQTELATRNVRLRHYHADGGGELICKLVLAELKSRGATYSWTPPDTPELNAVSERKFRTLFERALAMLLRAGLPVVFWRNAYETSVYEDCKGLYLTRGDCYWAGAGCFTLADLGL